jgi:lysozyme family protein
MNSNFPSALAFVLKVEGGYSDTPGDAGGPTDFGVTQLVYSAYRAAHGLPDQSVANIAASEVSDIYKSEYWDAVHGDELPAGVDLAAFDSAVNNGPGTSAKLLQQAAGVTADGSIGPATLAAVNAADPHALASRMIDMRVAYYRQICIAHPLDEEFLDGWLNRCAALRAMV